jgi:hypothetical protein
MAPPVIVCGGPPEGGIWKTMTLDWSKTRQRTPGGRLDIVKTEANEFVHREAAKENSP